MPSQLLVLAFLHLLPVFPTPGGQRWIRVRMPRRVQLPLSSGQGNRQGLHIVNVLVKGGCQNLLSEGEFPCRWKICNFEAVSDTGISTVISSCHFWIGGDRKHAQTLSPPAWLSATAVGPAAVAAYLVVGVATDGWQPSESGGSEALAMTSASSHTVHRAARAGDSMISMTQ